MRLQDLLIPLLAGGASYASPAAGRAISGGLGGYLTIKEDERRRKEHEDELAYRKAQQEQQQQMFSLQLAEAADRADEKNRKANFFSQAGPVFAEALPTHNFGSALQGRMLDGTTRGGAEFGVTSPGPEWKPPASLAGADVYSETKSFDVDPQEAMIEKYRRLAEIAAQQGYAPGVQENTERMSDLVAKMAAQKQADLRQVRAEGFEMEKGDQEFSDRMALEKARASENDSDMVSGEWVKKDGKWVRIGFDRKGNMSEIGADLGYEPAVTERDQLNDDLRQALDTWMKAQAAFGEDHELYKAAKARYEELKKLAEGAKPEKGGAGPGKSKAARLADLYPMVKGRKGQ